MVPALPSRQPAALTIAALQAQLRTGQARSKGTTARPPVPLGLAAIDRTLPWGGLPRGCLHEILAADASAAAAAFAAVLLARFAGRGGHVLWCRRRRGLYAPGLAGMDLDPAQLLMVHVEREADVLWVMEDALRCPALAAVLGEAEGRAITAARRRPFASIAELATRAGLAPGTLETLARADAFGSLKLDRRPALWAVLGLEDEPLPLFAPLFAGAEKGQEQQEPAVALPPAPLGEEVSEDYRAFGLSLKAHPLALLRERLQTAGYRPAARIAALRHEDRAKTAGLVITRQSPGSARGIIFITLEDETGQANLIVKPAVFARHRGTVLGAQMIGVEGRVQRQGVVVHVLAERLVTLDPLLAEMGARMTPNRAADEARFEVSSRDFH